MTLDHWLLIALLAVGAYGLRLAGLIGGQAILHNAKLKTLLDDLPGCLIVALVATSLADAAPLTWIAAAFALVVAIVSNNVVITMALGFAAMFGLQYFGVGV
ncbi:AzlD domain-containing protein [Sneathiella sp.]|uniref:AzlD domain-containing protein n=1 Tax=Sneathiella sp. TaxID=1964365 RepID=UPI002611BCA7|nr:AzlD domain-containing protein [Sneathiella sp.]MDF2367854.1 AzlD domain-containing protein [Sneathiella sp.]